MGVGPAPAQPGELEIALAWSSAVPNKKYRGPQQVALSKSAAKRGFSMSGPGPTRSTNQCTGVPNKNYRGPQQGSSSGGQPLTPLRRANKPKTRAVRPLEPIPGSPTRVTGVPNKHYRGPQQKVPGSPTKSTGVPNKKYRGPQQVALSKSAAKRGFLCRVFGPFVLVFIL